MSTDLEFALNKLKALEGKLASVKDQLDWSLKNESQYKSIVRSSLDRVSIAIIALESIDEHTFESDNDRDAILEISRTALEEMKK